MHARLYAARPTTLTEQILCELRERHDVADARFLVDRGAWLRAALRRHGLQFRHEIYGYCNTVERVYTKIKTPDVIV